MIPPNSARRMDSFGKVAPCYDLLLDLFTFGQYVRFLKKAVRILNPQQGEKILDLCSGTGRVASWMAHAVGDGGEVIGMDIAKQMVDVATTRYGEAGKLVFFQKDVTDPWDARDPFDGIFTSFAIHELPGGMRKGVLERSCAGLTERGRMVIADFNPHVSGRGKSWLLMFFKLFEKENLDFFAFNQKEVLREVGFKRVRTLPVFNGLLQITLATKEVFRKKN